MLQYYVISIYTNILINVKEQMLLKILKEVVQCYHKHLKLTDRMVSLKSII